MQSLEMTSGDSETTSHFGTWKGLPRNKCGSRQKLRQLLEAAAGCRQGLQYDKKWSFYFALNAPHNFNKLRPQTESCVFSNLGPQRCQEQTILLGTKQEQCLLEHNKNDYFWNVTRMILFGTKQEWIPFWKWERAVLMIVMYLRVHR